jgi:hypothetical protein
MTLSKRATVCLALFFTFSLLATMAFGGVRDYGTPYTDAGNVTWTGATPFYSDIYGNQSEILAGRIDWIVYGPGDFPYGDSGYVPPSNQYSYVYQILNSGNVAISDFQFSVDQMVQNIGSFALPGFVDGALAAGTSYAPGPGGYVDWWFEINVGSTSAGLVFTSPKAPTTTTTGSVTDGGGTIGGLELPAPGPNDIPEPGTFALLAAGLGLALTARRLHRR